jgi:four helix bundle protein
MNEDKKKSLSLQEMSVFKLASQVSDSVWKIVAQWDWFSKKTLGDQIVRSADSIGANIAEGYGRYFFKEYILFLYYSRGSIYETIYWLEKAQKRKLIDLAEYQEIKEKIDQLPIEINKVIKIIKTESKKWKK